MKRKIFKAAAVLLSGLIFLGAAGCQGRSGGSAAQSQAESAQAEQAQEDALPADGQYQIPVELEGGSGRASVSSPASLQVKDGSAILTLIWSSAHYDYMIVDGEKYFPVNTEGNSSFEIPVRSLDQPLPVRADTTAMSQPHEIEYILHFDKDGLSKGESAAGQSTQEETGDQSPAAETGEQSPAAGRLTDPASIDPDISADLTFTKQTAFSAAKRFAIFEYQDGYRLLSICDGTKLLVVPEGKAVPADLPEQISLVRQPLDDIYLVSSSDMDFFDALGALDRISYVSKPAGEWASQNANDAIRAGNMTYAGKYSAPDYELLLSGGCSFVIENSMILHSPQVLEKLRSLGMTAIVDYSSYESDPLARAEWVRFYGVLAGQEEKAGGIFKQISGQISQTLAKAGQTEKKTVLAFYFTSAGQVNVRRAGDYFPQMVENAGGTYLLPADQEEHSANAAVTMQMENFLELAEQADILIYDGTIDSQVKSREDLLARSRLLENCPAMQSGNVFRLSGDLYQKPLAAGDAMEEISRILAGDKTDSGMKYLSLME